MFDRINFKYTLRVLIDSDYVESVCMEMINLEMKWKALTLIKFKSGRERTLTLTEIKNSSIS